MRPHLTLLLATTVFLTLTACSKGPKSANNVTATGTPPPPPAEKYVTELHYFRGGWYGMPNTANWAHDYVIKFNQPINGVIPVAGKDPDALCFRTGGMDQAQVQVLANLLSGLKLAVSTGPQGADAGVETIEVTLDDGEKRTYHLMRFEAPLGAYYATNPEGLSAFLNDLGDNLAVGCQ
ncbi:MAG: hypothetical protein AB7F86_20210 [Bdellovibrionales bacterium]